MADATIYHNPKCSKSRQTLALLRERGADLDVVEYLTTPPSVAELNRICLRLDCFPLQVIRTKEARFVELGLSQFDDRSREEWLTFMHENPILIERPIVVRGETAAIGRPPEAVLTLF